MTAKARAAVCGTTSGRIWSTKVLQLFGPPLAVSADLARQREGAQATDYFHVQLRYPRLRAILHAGALVPGHGLRFAVHGSGGSWFKHGLDPQEDALRGGAVPGTADWGRDPRPGTLLQVQADGSTHETPSPTAAGDYLATTRRCATRSAAAARLRSARATRCR